MEERLEALRLAETLPPTPANIERVAAATSAAAARWAFGQWALRARARDKFSLAREMLFDREGLEMASHEKVARWHASLFTGHAPLADLTVGIGGDLIALAGQCDRVVGFELDPERAWLAEHNLAVNHGNASLRVEDCLSATWNFDCAFADPARRHDAGRTLRPEDFQPPLSKLCEKMASLHRGAIKLSPMLDDGLLAKVGQTVAFVSYGWECREALVLLGRDGSLSSQAREGVWAVNVETGEHLRGESQPTSQVDVPSAWIWDCDPGAVRAHAWGRLGGEALGSAPGYLTARSPSGSAWARSYEAVWHGPWRPDRVRRAVAGLRGKVVAVKTRGVRVDVRAAQRQTTSAGPEPLVLFIYPAGPRACAALARMPAACPEKAEP